ncbi:MAG TPA: PAS domain S-box protein [Roseiflexaceae bacterium]|nr:PAS domain S-box protein [Roseiflexaceae bacterium]
MSRSLLTIGALARALLMSLRRRASRSARRDERALRVSQARFAGIVNLSEDAIISIDGEQRITLFNPSAERLFGYRAEEVLGRPLDILLPERHREAHARHVRAFAASADASRPMHARGPVAGLRRDGTEFPAEASIAKFAVEGEIVLTARLRDISERLAVEERLRGSEERFRLLVEGVRDYAIFMLDPGGRVVSWNSGAERITGYRAEEAVGRHFSFFYPEEDVRGGKPARELKIAIAEGRYEEEGWCIRKDGSHFLAHLLVTPLYDEAGRLRGFGKVTRDITERKRAEDVRRRSLELEADNRRIQEANRLKSEFLANMSHELRTPLNGIIGFAELMHDGKVGPVSAEHQEYLGDILTSARHLLRLINDILDLARVETGKLEFHPQPCDLAQLIDEVRHILRATAVQKRIRVETAVDPALETVTLDPVRLKQVLYNYLSNALKFTEPEGRVTMRAAPVEPEVLGVEAFRLEVEDSGVGIAPEDVGRLFQEFEQLDAGRAKRHQGAGLGLALTKRLVEAQGGRVGVESAPGRGSTFFAILPCTAHAAGAAADTLPVAAPPGGATVLVVEDDSDDRSWLMRTLSAAGYGVEGAATGAEALAKARARAFDAVTLDLLLPDMAGWDVLAAIHATPLNAAVPAVVVTVVAEREAGVGFAIQDFLVKPVSVEELLAALERAGVTSAHATAVLVVDDDATILQLMERTLSRQGMRPICRPDAEGGLRVVREERPDAVILDLTLPEMDGFTFLERLRSEEHGRDVPVIVWSGRTLTDAERARLESSAQAIVAKHAGGAAALLRELRAQLLPRGG